MVTRWARPPSSLSIRKVQTRRQEQQDRLSLRPLDDEGFVWPDLGSISDAQHKLGDKSVMQRLQEGDDGIRR
eukprot:jgi/Phyca11/113387/e_gw1.24.210.1